MDIRPLTPDLAVAPQITPDQVPALAEAGFRMLINNRPDSEVGPELSSAAMEQAALAAGMAYVYNPFEPGQVTPEMITIQAEAIRKHPAFAYCRSGNRSTVLWALSQAGVQPIETLLATADKAGYDLTPILPLLQSLAGRNEG
ncbi:TIGR01244 family sulfur transferase [Paracoccus pacificus]|uniref:TIGR01244 family sulfur transferase n=1 Tax=Paracoccus pacificus TaxID=1463598 RepID=A0ABW4R3Z7_9RHOB